MGTVCGTEERVFRKLEEYLHPDSLHAPFTTAPATHSRFGNIEKIRTRKAEVFKLIMATSDAKMQTVSIDCRVLESTAEFQLYEGTKFELQDRAISPVIDIFCPNETQVYHPVKTAGRNNLTLKAYPFSSYSDSVLKRAIYQIWICGQLRAGSPLVDHFIMSRGKASTLVLLCRNYECSLLEVVRYRQLADYHWSEAEVVTLWKMLISNYRQLSLLSIAHRDIRLGKVFYTPDDRTRPFQFANLATARKVTRAEASDLLTVVGVAPFAESPMREKIERGEEVGMYDPFNYDISCLVRVLLSILNLDPLEKESLTCRNSRLAPIVQKLREGSSLQQVERELEGILRTLTFDRETLFREDRIISEHLSRSQLRRKNRERIDECYFNTLLQTHKKEAFNRLLLERMEQHDAAGTPHLNIALLQKVGEYYANVGLDRNQYFQEEFRLLLDLAKQSREEDFSSQHQDYLEQAGKLQELIPKENDELRVRYSTEVLYRFMAEGKLEAATQRLTALLDLSARQALHINTQLDVLIAKARLELQAKQLEATQSTVEKVGSVVGTNDFETVHDAKRYQGELELLRGRLQLQVMTTNRQEIKKKRLALAEVSLNNALSIFTNLPESPSNTATIVHCHLGRAELAEIKEDYPEARRSLDSADILLSEMEKTRTVSPSLREKVLLGLKRVYQRSNRASEPGYKTTLDRLSKIATRPTETNASRLQRSKEMKAREKVRNKQERMMTNQLAIEELIEEEQT